MDQGENRNSLSMSMARSVSACAACAALSACLEMPEGAAERDPVFALSIPSEYSEIDRIGPGIVEGLLDLFDDETLRSLVDHALRHNLDVRLKQKQLEEAGFQTNAQRAGGLPYVAADATVERSRSAREDPATSYSPSLNAVWELDIWGKHRTRGAMLEATVSARSETLQAVRNSVAARAMQGWFDVVTTEMLVALESSRLTNLEKIAEDSQARYRSGLTSLDDLAAVQRDIAETKSSLAQSSIDRAAAARDLQVLLGSYPDGVVAHGRKLPTVIPAPDAGLPASLITERPDLRAAWHEVVSADHSVNIAHKELYPSLSLTGSLGRQSADFSQFLSGATIWSLASSLTVPLFDASRLRNDLKTAHSRADQAWIHYLQSALRAFGEVEQTLNAETLLAEREHWLREAERHAEAAAGVFKERYRIGLVSIIEHLAAQNAVFDLRRQLISVRNMRLNNRVALALALGKGV